MTVQSNGVSVEFDGQGRIRAITGDHKLGRTEAARIIAAQGPMPTDAERDAERERAYVAGSMS